MGALADNWLVFSERCLFPILDGKMPVTGGLTEGPATTPLDGKSILEAFPTATTYVDAERGFEMGIFPTEEGPGFACIFFSLPGSEMDAQAFEDWIAARVVADEFYEDRGGILRGSYNSRGYSPKSRVSGLYGYKDGQFAGLFAVSQYTRE